MNRRDALLGSVSLVMLGLPRASLADRRFVAKTGDIVMVTATAQNPPVDRCVCGSTDVWIQMPTHAYCKPCIDQMGKDYVRD